jgi:hypothetical protein
MSNENSRVSLVVGLALIGLGALFLVQQFFDFNFWDTLWPFFVIGGGGLLFLIGIMGGRESAGLFIPASIVTTVGSILFVLNLTDRWEAWSYAWTLIIAAVGAGLWLQGLRLNDAALQKRGRQTLQSGLVMLLFFGAFFELIIFGSARVTRWAGPALLIVAGGYLLLRNALGGRRDSVARVQAAPTEAAGNKEVGGPPLE